MDRKMMQKNFYECLNKRSQKPNSFHMSSTKYHNIIVEVKSAKSGNKKENRHYWLLRHYDIVTINTTEKLVFPIVNPDQILYYVIFEELFDILYETHVSIGHGGRDKMKKYLQQRYKNITAQDIQTFLNLCETCLQKRKCEKKVLVTRCQVNLIDFHSQADGEFKFIMVYQDHLTKFIILRALKSKNAIEVAEQLLNIFLIFGAPSILQSDNGCEFANRIIEELKELWPELKIIHGKLQGSDKRSNQDIENMLNAWMLQENCNKWSKGLGFIQFMKNRSLYAGIKRSPYKAMFGHPARIGLKSSALPPDSIQHISSEEGLENILKINAYEENFHENLTDKNKVDFKIDEEQKIKFETRIKTEVLDYEFHEQDNVTIELERKSEIAKKVKFVKEENYEIDEESHPIEDIYIKSDNDMYNSECVGLECLDEQKCISEVCKKSFLKK